MPCPSVPAGLCVLIVGGGASGVILAAHLLRDAPAGRRVVLLERRPLIGAGIAYSTDEPDHLLNTRVSGMSAFPDEPDHFADWLGRQPGTPSGEFVPRRVYRRYLHDLVAPWLAGSGDGRLRIVRGECADLRETGAGVVAELAGGGSAAGDLAVLATGHAEPAPDRRGGRAGAWDDSSAGGDAGDGVAILGTGLSMVDAVLRLRRAGHRGPITAVSRNGRLPHVHAAVSPMAVAAADLPLGAELSAILRRLRATVRTREREGGDWREVVDGLRPHTQALWQAMSADQKRRFLRHARGVWEVHRHRMAPDARRALDDILAEGGLRILAGRASEEAGGLAVRLRGGGEARVPADRVIDCTGIRRDPTGDRGDLLARLVRRGAARLDDLAIGLDVDARCAIVSGEGTASARIFALGPVTRARFWECTAIPDIRVQAAALARQLGEAAGERAARA